MKKIIFLFIFFLANIVYLQSIEIPVIIWKKSVIYDEIISGLEYYSKNSGINEFTYRYVKVDESREKSIELYNKFNSKENLAAIFVGTGLAELIIGNDNFNPKTNLMFIGVNNLLMFPEYEKKIQKHQDKIFFLHYFKEAGAKIQLFETLFYKIKKIGFLYNPGNEASRFELPDLKKFCAQNSIELFEYKTPDKNQKENFIASLKKYSKTIKNIDLLIVPSNTEISTNLNLLIDDNFKIPTLCYQKDGLYKNGMISLWPDLFKQGKIIHGRLSELKNGKKKIPANDYKNKFNIFVNFNQVSSTGLKIPVKYIAWLKAVKN